MFVLDPADESYLEVIGSNTSMVASFSSTTDNAYVRFYGNDPSSNVGYVIGSSNMSPSEATFVIGQIASDTSNIVPNLCLVRGNVGVGTTNPVAGLHVASLIRSDLLSPSKVLVSDTSMQITSSSVSTTELGYLSGVTSSLQTQLSGKQPIITGAATSISNADLPVGFLLVSDSSGKVAASATTSNEITYLSGVTSPLQAQINAKLSTSGGTISGNLAVTNVLTTSNLSASNVVIQNVSGFGPALTVKQKTNSSSDSVAEFFDTDISSTVPVFKVADGGNVGIGTSDPLYKLHVEGNIYANQIAFASDAALKTNVRTISNALATVELLRGVSYERIDTREKQIGLIAQEVELIFPEVVGQTAQGKSIAYANLVAVLIEAIKELSNQVKDLKAAQAIT